MKSTGIIRRMDELGRVVIPIEIRNQFNIGQKDPIEIYVDGSSIVLKKFEPNCIFCGNTKNLLEYHNKLICKDCSKKIGDLKENKTKEVGTVEFKNVSNSAKKAVNIACLCIMSVIILYWIYTLIGDAAAYFDDIQNLCNAIFPVFVTLLSVSGANASASALSPAAAVFSAALIGIVKNIVIPIAIAVLVLSVAGNLSDDIPLDGLRTLLENVSGNFQILRTPLQAALPPRRSSPPPCSRTLPTNSA